MYTLIYKTVFCTLKKLMGETTWIWWFILAVDIKILISFWFRLCMELFQSKLYECKCVFDGTNGLFSDSHRWFKFQRKCEPYHNLVFVILLGKAWATVLRCLCYIFTCILELIYFCLLKWTLSALHCYCKAAVAVFIGALKYDVDTVPPHTQMPY